MKKKITARLSISSIDNLIQQVESYKKNLNDKNALFVRRLAEAGIPVVDRQIAKAKGDSDKSHYTHVEVHSFGNHSQARLIVEGKDLLFIEFGAGVHYNGEAGQSPHPKGEEMGYTIGSYGQGHGQNDSWVYVAETGEWIRSYGTESTMPVFEAGQEIREKVRKIAKEVFR